MYTYMSYHSPLPPLLSLIVFSCLLTWAILSLGNSSKAERPEETEQDSLSPSNLTIPLVLAVSSMFFQCLLYFGIQVRIL